MRRQAVRPPLERQVLDALPITVYAVDLDGRITFTNRSWARLTQSNGAPQPFDERAVIGSSIWDAITDSSVRLQLERAMATLREGRATSLSWEFPCSSATETHTFLMQASALVDTQTVSGYALSTVDITPSHRSQEMRVETGVETVAAIEHGRSAQHAEHKWHLEAVGEVSAGVARELRNPLFGISSAAQLLRFRVKDDPVVEKNVGRILREVERLNNLTTALLEYGRPDPIRPVPADPDAVWDEVLENQRGLLESRALLLHRTRVQPPLHIPIDPPQLAQVLINLLVNAADAAPEGTDLTLQTARTASGGWRCRLHNTGPAIPPDVLPRVFEIFFSTKPGSTGIGLALCRRIIEEHGGTIELESASESGTTATITLPGT